MGAEFPICSEMIPKNSVGGQNGGQKHSSSRPSHLSRRFSAARLWLKDAVTPMKEQPGLSNAKQRPGFQIAADVKM
jgi:hypothetical protein